MPIAINGSGTITGVSVGGLPDGIVDADMIAAGAVTAAKRGAGAILQIVQATANTEVSISSTTYTDIGLSASITPSSSSNKVLVLANVQVYCSRGGNQGAGVRIFRGSTQIFTSVEDGTGPYEIYSASSSIGGRFTYTKLDSPATTSATTYKLQGRPYTTASSGRADFFDTGNNEVGSGQLILMEVAA